AFAALSVFRGGWTVEAAEAVCDATTATLEALVANALVEPEGTRLRMLETIREYAEERLDALEHASDVRRRHAWFFVELARTARGAGRRAARDPRRCASDGGATRARARGGRASAAVVRSRRAARARARRRRAAGVGAARARSPRLVRRRPRQRTHSLPRERRAVRVDRPVRARRRQAHLPRRPRGRGGKRRRGTEPDRAEHRALRPRRRPRGG